MVVVGTDDSLLDNALLVKNVVNQTLNQYRKPMKGVSVTAGNSEGFPLFLQQREEQRRPTVVNSPVSDQNVVKSVS